MPQNRILIMGGTFDPPHIGHVMSAKRAMEALGASELIIIPNYMPPHKKGAGNMASPTDRFNMCRLAFLPIGGVNVSDFEIKKQEKSYTIDTLRALKEAHGESELVFLMGSDMLISFESWKDFKDILSLCSLAVMRRNEKENEQNEHMKRYLSSKYGASIYLLPHEPFKMSSTKVREAVKEGADISTFVTVQVEKYIKERGLYR